MASLAETLVKQQAGGTGSNGPRASSYRLHLPADQRPNGAPGGQMGGGSPVKPEDPDIYISSVAATWGRVDLINDWLPHNKHEPEKIARLVLSRAAMYGQLGVLRRTEALLYGDLNMTDDKEFPGWTLMHFAVEGVYRVFTKSEEPHVEFTEPVSGCPEPKSKQDIVWIQLDILHVFANAGAPLNLPDREGETPSAKACRKVTYFEAHVKEYETKSFLEGAMLLDVLTLMKSRKEGTTDPSTPGLAAADLPSSTRQSSLVRLVEWAYDRHLKKLSDADDDEPHSPGAEHTTPLEILKFLHLNNTVNLAAPGLTLPSTGYPLVMAALHKHDWALLQLLHETQTRACDNMLCKKYEYDILSRGKQTESLLSYACHQAVEGSPDVIATLLSPQCFGHVTDVVLCDVDLCRLPADIFCPSLANLDVHGNDLDSLPLTEPTCDLSELRTLNISCNNFTSLQKQLFLLTGLERLDASNNKIATLPVDMWSAPSLKRLDLSSNQISDLPISMPTYRSMSTTPASTNTTSFSSFLSFFLQSSRDAHIDEDSQSITDQRRSYSGFCLESLDLSDNCLKDVPAGLPCLAPLLRYLKLNKNQITHIGVTADYPSLLHMLDLSYNCIEEEMLPFSESSETFLCYQSPLVNSVPHCSHMHHQQLRHLRNLYLQHNRLTQFDVMKPKNRFALESLVVSANSAKAKMPDSIPLFPKLQGLKLSANHLEAVPYGIHFFEELCDLAIDDNPRITVLPLNLHRLSKLFMLRYDGIGDPIVSELKRLKSTPEVLLYLRARELSAETDATMRLFIIGHHKKGKTTLLNHLAGRPVSGGFDQRAGRIVGDGPHTLSTEERQSTVGIECNQWVCSKKRNATRKDPKITFYTWDFAGQEEYYCTHQCFLVSRALYLLAWNVNDGDRGIESLGVWLQNLQAKVTGSTVIIVGTHLDTVPNGRRKEKCRQWKEAISRRYANASFSRSFPNIKGIHFVGCPRKGRGIEVENFNDLIYSVAANMTVPKGASQIHCPSLKIIEEKIPRSYGQLRLRIGELLQRRRDEGTPPIMKKREFYSHVMDILPEADDIDAAVDFLCRSTGVILLFDVPSLMQYYVIDPQRWFDYCALVISPDSVSRLVRRHGGDTRSGQLKSQEMDAEFKKKGIIGDTSVLIRMFLREYRIIHQLNQEFYLVPSLIASHPPHPLMLEKGSFPMAENEIDVVTSLNDVALDFAPAALHRLMSRKLHVQKTGLVFRRLLLFPTISPGFWSSLISLFIQKSDVAALIQSASPMPMSMHAAAPDQLRVMIGDLTAQWQYWKTGIYFTIDHELLLRVNSLHTDQFADPQKREALSDRQKQLSLLAYQDHSGWTTPPEHFSEAIEIIVPEVRIIHGDADLCELHPDEYGCHDGHYYLSSKILAKALEIIDEVIKSHCENLAVMGIYSPSDMLHLIPCPLCSGDRDKRKPPEDEETDDFSAAAQLTEQEDAAKAKADSLFQLFEKGATFMFTVAEIIKRSFDSDHIKCPGHEKLELIHVAPDLVFADLANVKLNKKQLASPLDRDEKPAARGSFAKVVKRYLKQEGRSQPLEVAVKIFDHFGSANADSAAELVRTYSDMRYELNKVVSLSHAFIVQFVGVFTNPHCFVLEWAPLKTLESIRCNHIEANHSICPTSMYLMLIQMTDALNYLHRPPIGVVHNDLKLSNVLVFRFPTVGHNCHADSPHGCVPCLSDSSQCGVLVKLADMGISANPTAHRTRNRAGIHQFVPECLLFDSGLQEKVDIFTLGTALYELMTLRGLPSNDINEMEYRNMLQTGTRPRFSPNDRPYPLLLFDTLERCWKQEFVKRPSAADIHDNLVKFTGLSVTDDDVTVSSCKTLLDSYILREGYRLTALFTTVERHSLSMCTTLISPDNSAVDIMFLSHQPQGMRRKIAMETLGEVYSPVNALGMAPNGEILAGCDDGQLKIYDGGTTRSFTPANCCSIGGEHGPVIGLHYSRVGDLLVVGFAGGQIHISDCKHGIYGSMSSSWRVYCSPLADKQPLTALECVTSTSPDSITLWCGSDNNRVEVWSIAIEANLTWSQDTVVRDTKLHTINSPSLQLPKDMEVQTMQLSHDNSVMMALLRKQDAAAIAFYCVRSKELRKVVDCTLPRSHKVSCFALSCSHFMVGTYQGAIHLFDADTVLNGPHESLGFILSQSLTAHSGTVFHILSMEGGLDEDGFTSYFPTFMGRSQQSLQAKFLVSFGYGFSPYSRRGTAKVYGDQHPKGTYINAWMI